MKATKLMVLSIALASCIACISCGRNSAGAASPTGQTAPQVEVVPVKSQKLDTTLNLPAELAAYQSVDIYAKQTGFVKSIRVDRGSKVHQGELLAELEAPEIVAQRAQANANFESAQSHLAAAQAKFETDQVTFQHMSNAAKTPGVVAGNDLETAQRAAQSDEANVAALRKTAEAAQESLKAISQLVAYLKITAPFDGEITTRYVHTGALVGPGGQGVATPIVRIETSNHHRLVVPVPENYAEGVREGTLVNFTVPSFPGKTFRAPIARVSHGVDLQTRTMPVELDVRDPHAELAPGTFCSVAWPVRRTYPTLFLPVTAVASDLQRSFVIRIRQNRIDWVDVKTGARTGDAVEVFGDLQEGDQVALRGTDQLRAGTEVTPHLANSK